MAEYTPVGCNIDECRQNLHKYVLKAMLRITEVISSFVRRLYMLRKSLGQNELNWAVYLL